MAGKNIKMNLSMEDKGNSIKARTNDAKALNKELERSQKLAGGTKTGSQAAAMTDRSYGQARGAMGATGASGRDFANQAQGLGGLVRLYATYAANVFAVGAAFRALREAAAVDNMIAGMNQLGAASGVALGSMAKAFADASDGAISLQEAVRATTKASAAGLSSEQFAQLGKVAKSASLALGVDMQDAVSRLTRGITKLEPELLDELGIFTKIGPATDAYAKSIGKSASQLTDFERRQAFANAVLEEGRQKFGEIEGQANPYDKLSASLQNLAQQGLSLVNTVLVPIVETLSASPTALTAGLALIGTTIVKQALPALGQYRKELEESSKVSAELAKQKGMEAEGARAAIGQQALQKLEAVAEAKIEAVDKAAEKVAELEKKVGKNTTAHKILQKAVQDVTQEELKYLEAVERRLRGQGHSDAANRYKEATVAIRGSIQAEENYAIKEREVNAELGKRLTWYQKIFTAQGRTIAAAERAQNIASRKQLVSGAANDAQVGGIMYAYKNLSKGIGEKGLTGFAAGLTRVSGIATIATTAITGLLGAISTIGMIVGAAVAAFKLLDGILTSTAEELKAYKSATENTNMAVETLTATTKRYAKEGITIESILANANANNTLTASLKEQIAAYNELIKKAGFWDVISGKTNPKELAKSMGKSLEAMFSAMNDPKAKKEAENEIGRILSQATLDLNDEISSNIMDNILSKGINSDTLSQILPLASKEERASIIADIQKFMEEHNRQINNSAEPLRGYKDALKENVSMYQALVKEAKLKGDAEVNAAVSTLDLIEKTNAGLKDQQNAVATIKELAASDDKTLSLMFGVGNTSYLKSLGDTLKTAKSVPADVMNKVQSILDKATKDSVDKLERPFNNLATKIQGELSKTLLGFVDNSEAKIDAMLAIEQQNLAIQKQDIEAKRRLVQSQLEAADALTEAALVAKLGSSMGQGDRAVVAAANELQTFREARDQRQQNSYRKELGGFDLQLQQLAGQSQNLDLKSKFDRLTLANTIAQQDQQRENALTAAQEANFKLSPTYANMTGAERAAKDADLAFAGTRRAYQESRKKLTDKQEVNRQLYADPNATEAVKKAIAEANVELEKQLKHEQDVFDERLKGYQLSKDRAVEEAKITATQEKSQLALQGQQLTQQILSDATDRRLGYEQEVLQYQINSGMLTADQAQAAQAALDKKVLAQELAVNLDLEEIRHKTKLLELETKIKLAKAGKADPQIIENLKEQVRQENLRHDSNRQGLKSQADLGQRVIDMNNEMSASQKALRDRFVQGFEDMGDAIVDFVMTGKASFGDLVKSMIADMIKLQMRQQMAQLGNFAMSAIMSAFSPNVSSMGGNIKAGYKYGGWAQGGAFDSGIEKFAKGGMFTNSIVNQPTMFKFAQGVGLMGEAGPEAIMPLKRDSSGNLGVRSNGNSTQVTIINNTGQQVQEQQTQDSKGNRKIEIVVGETAAGQVKTNGSQMQNSMRSTYGLQPALIRR